MLPCHFTLTFIIRNVDQHTRVLEIRTHHEISHELLHENSSKVGSNIVVILRLGRNDHAKVRKGARRDVTVEIVKAFLRSATSVAVGISLKRNEWIVLALVQTVVGIRADRTKIVVGHILFSFVAESASQKAFTGRGVIFRIHFVCESSRFHNVSESDLVVNIDRRVTIISVHRKGRGGVGYIGVVGKVGRGCNDRPICKKETS